MSRKLWNCACQREESLTYATSTVKKEEYIKVTHSQPEHNKTLFHDNMLKIIIV